MPDSQRRRLVRRDARRAHHREQTSRRSSSTGKRRVLRGYDLGRRWWRRRWGSVTKRPAVEYLAAVRREPTAQVGGVGPQHWHLGQLGPVALEVAVVAGIEADQRREESDAGLGDRVPDEGALRLQPVRQP